MNEVLDIIDFEMQKDMYFQEPLKSPKSTVFFSNNRLSCFKVYELRTKNYCCMI